MGKRRKQYPEVELSRMDQRDRTVYLIIDGLGAAMDHFDGDRYAGGAGAVRIRNVPTHKAHASRLNTVKARLILSENGDPRGGQRTIYISSIIQ